MDSREKVLIHKGIDKVKSGEFEEALGFYNRVLEKNPHSTDAWNNMGVALFKMGRTAEAIESYERAIEADPGNLDAIRNKGFVLRSLGRLEEALEMYSYVVETAGESRDMQMVAMIYLGMGRLEEALHCLIQCAEVSPSEEIEKTIEILKGMLEEQYERSAGIEGDSPG